MCSIDYYSGRWTLTIAVFVSKLTWICLWGVEISLVLFNFYIVNLVACRSLITWLCRPNNIPYLIVLSHILSFLMPLMYCIDIIHICYFSSLQCLSRKWPNQYILVTCTLGWNKMFIWQLLKIANLVYQMNYSQLPIKDLFIILNLLFIATVIWSRHRKSMTFQTWQYVHWRIQKAFWMHLK